MNTFWRWGMDVHEISRQDDPPRGCLTRLTMAIYGLGSGRGSGGSLDVESALREVPGVTQVYIDPAMEMVYIQCMAGITHADQLVHAIEAAGFGAGELRIR
jgi:hypothetical protein